MRTPRGAAKRPIGTAIVGLGKVAEFHADALASLPESTFVGVLGRTSERTQEFAARYGVRGFSSLEEIIQDPSIEAVSVCTPHPTHAEVGLPLIRARKHVLVEKPLATSLADCDAMIEAADEHGVRLSVVSQRRWYEPVRRAKDAIDGGRIGQPVLATLELFGWRGPEYYAMDPWRGTWAGEGGGVLVNQGTHLLDLFQWFVGPVREVDGFVANLSHPTIEVEDSAVAIVRFANGAIGTIVTSNSQFPGLYGRIHVHGDNGASVGVQTETGSAFVAGVTGQVEPPFNDLWTVTGDEHHLAAWRRADRRAGQGVGAIKRHHRLQIHDFLTSIYTGRESAVSGREGRKSVELFVALYRAQRSATRISFPLGLDVQDSEPPWPNRQSIP